jgi:hypothetical protein
MIKKILNLINNCFCNYNENSPEGKNLEYLKHEMWYRKRFGHRPMPPHLVDTGIEYQNSEIRC